MSVRATSDYCCETIVDELQTTLLSRIGEFKMMPDVAQEALGMVKDPNCSTAQFAAVVERDISLTTTIVSLANSAAFAGGRTVASLHQAVSRLGFQRCRNLIMTSGVAGLMQKISLEQHWVRERLWQHGFTTAMIALHLNRFLRLGYQGEEFTAGLIHDIGRTLLAFTVPEVFFKVDPLDFQEDSSAVERERERLGTDHCEFGAWFATHNSVPDMLVDVIRYHHTPQMAGANQGLVALTAAADHMANSLQRGQDPESYDMSGNEGLLILREESRRTFSADVTPLLVSLLRTVQVDLHDLANVTP